MLSIEEYQKLPKDWDVVGAVSEAVDDADAVYSPVDRAVFEAVNDAAYWAVNRAVWGAVWGAVNWAFDEGFQE